MDIFDIIFNFAQLHGWFEPIFAVFATVCIGLFLCGIHAGLFDNVSGRKLAFIGCCSVLPVISLFSYMIYAMHRYSFSFDYVETQRGTGDTIEEMVKRAVARSNAHSWPQYTTVTYVDTSKRHAVRVIGYSRYIYDDESYDKNLYNEYGVVESKTVFKCEYGNWN